MFIVVKMYFVLDQNLTVEKSSFIQVKLHCSCVLFPCCVTGFLTALSQDNTFINWIMPSPKVQSSLKWSCWLWWLWFLVIDSGLSDSVIGRSPLCTPCKLAQGVCQCTWPMPYIVTYNLPFLQCFYTKSVYNIVYYVIDKMFSHIIWVDRKLHIYRFPWSSLYCIVSMYRSIYLCVEFVYVSLVKVYTFRQHRANQTAPKMYTNLSVLYYCMFYIYTRWKYTLYI